MCYNTREIRIKGTNKTMRVNCGHCPACLMEKAIRNKDMITSHSKDGNVWIFFTLHYTNLCCPYVYKDELKDRQVLTVYRDSSVYKAKSRKNVYRYRRNYGIAELGEFLNDYYRPEKVVSSYLSGVTFDSFYNNPSIAVTKHYRYVTEPVKPFFDDFDKLKAMTNYDANKIGVLWYPDVQNFFKRLKINLSRHYGFDYTDGYYYCGEYGPTTYRPHFHGLVSCKAEYAEIVKNTIVESWPYGSAQRTRRYCQIARNAASYVASYVNGDCHLPLFLQQKHIKPKTQHTHFFGVNLDAFSAKSFYTNTLRGNVTYDAVTLKNKVPVHIAVPYPKRICDKYIPKCKGFSRLTDCEVYLLYSGLRSIDSFDYKLWHRHPFSYYHGALVDGRVEFSRSKSPYVTYVEKDFIFSPSDVLHKKPVVRYNVQKLSFIDERMTFSKRLFRARSLFKTVTGLNDMDFGRLAVDFYNKRKSFYYKSLFDNLLPSQYLYVYDNNEILLSKPGISPTLSKFIDCSTRFGANNNPIRCAKTFELTLQHEQCYKRSKVIDKCVDYITFNNNSHG